jgi:hypothetical protein
MRHAQSLRVACPAKRLTIMEGLILSRIERRSASLEVARRLH